MPKNQTSFLAGLLLIALVLLLIAVSISVSKSRIPRLPPASRSRARVPYAIPRLRESVKALESGIYRR